MNDVIATDGDTEAFINKYAAVIESITKRDAVRPYLYQFDLSGQCICG